MITARECLVDMADRDYLTSRLCWRANLMEHFLWNALQAIEKYLKGVLLFNDKSAKGLGHDIQRAFSRVLLISDITFDFEPELSDFISFLNQNGHIRYFDKPFFVRGVELIRLDRAVWFIRRYCQDLRAKPDAIPLSNTEWLARQVASVQHQRYFQVPQRFKLFDGFLEEVLEGKHGTELRSALIWQNIYFGAKRRLSITLPGRFKSAIPPHFRHPKVYLELAQYLDFPATVSTALKGSGA